MKQLSDYPTPETDAKAESIWKDSIDQDVIDHARNLERRLALCHEALEKSQASNKRRRTELHRLNKMLRALWDGVRFSHKCTRDMENKSKL